MSFDLYKGEILGFWGLLGSGRTEIMRALLGLDRTTDGERFIKKKNDTWGKISGKSLLVKCGYITEDRHSDGLFLKMPLYKNFSIASLSKFRNRTGLLKKHEEQAETQKYIENLKIAASHTSVKAEQLSGGNQQKLIIARWIHKEPDFFVFDEPTRGVDVNAKAELHQHILNLVAKGNSVILISSEIEEIVNLSSRVLVVNGGTIVAEVSKDEICNEKLKSLCLGKEDEIEYEN